MSNELFFPEERYEVIFMDFDGVIKESVEAKSVAFESTFNHLKSDCIKKITEHHRKNGGVSRAIKIPLYLRWSGIKATDDNIQLAKNLFASFAKKNVINSEWVPGVLDFLSNVSDKISIVLVTATPKNEIEEILKELNIFNYFEEIYGSPTSKEAAILHYLSLNVADKKKAIFIGDSKEDYLAAKKVGIDFKLRITKYNNDEQKINEIIKFNNF